MGWSWKGPERRAVKSHPHGETCPLLGSSRGKETLFTNCSSCPQRESAESSSLVGERKEKEEEREGRRGMRDKEIGLFEMSVEVFSDVPNTPLSPTHSEAIEKYLYPFSYTWETGHLQRILFLTLQDHADRADH